MKKEWWKSGTVWAGIVGSILSIVGIVREGGFAVDPETIQLVGTLVASILAIVFRGRKDIKSLTNTRQPKEPV